MLGGVQSRSVTLVRAPGSSAVLLSPTFFPGWALVLLPSGAMKILKNASVFAHEGCVQLQLQEKVRLFKAGRMVRSGRRPQVRGTVKNSCDHPNGGRSRALALSRTPWGFPTKKSRRTSKS
jgi:ribosomal protein L2